MLQIISSKIKKIIAIALIILISSSTMSNVFASSTAIVNTSALLLRSDMSTNSTILIAIPQGETLELEYIAQDWCKVKYGKLSGFVMRKYLIINDYVASSQNPITDIDLPNVTTKLGDKGDEVLKLQKALNKIGYYNGAMDGSFGKQTEDSVIAFQKSMNLTADGVAGTSTIAAISKQFIANTNNNLSVNYNKVNSIAEIGTMPNTSKLGDKGQDVVKLQQALNVLGYFNGPIDGNFGLQTEDALKRFQKNRKMTVDGIAGPGTLSVIFGSNINGHIAVVQNTVNNSTNTFNQENTYNQVNNISEIGSMPNATKLGDSGIDVAKLQQALNVLGYYSGTIDGDFGSATELAVKRFQTNRKMKVDGIAGPGTLSVLFGSTITGANATIVNNNTTSTTTQVTGSLSSAAKEQQKLTITSIEDIGDTPATSKKGDVGIDVVKLQQALKVSGYYNGTIDGSYGEGTEKAVMNFQRKRSMKDDGIAGPATIRVLFGSKAANAANYVSVLEPEESNTINDPNKVSSIDAIGSVPNTSKPGDKGEDVKKLQQALNVLGYYNNIIDSYYGEETEKAVSAFQRKRGMGADGIAGPSTIRIIFGEKAANANTYVSSTPVTVVTSDEDMGDIFSIADIGVPATSKPGDKGEDVKKLQQALKLLSFYEGAIDGSFGEGTKNALMKFQKKRGMNADGVAGPSTIRIIFGEPATNASSYTSSNTSGSGSDKDKNMAGINTIADIGSVPKTSKPGDYSTDVKKLQQALKLLGYFNGNVDSRYGETTKQAVIKFQAKKGMSEDGVAGATTIRLLFGKEAQNAATASSKKYKTEKIDWFKGGSRIIPKKAIFQIKDIKTGKVFKAMRWSGMNHMDCEPLTKEDTATMKSIFGGFSWSRRAILIKYNDHVYAASMNGFPHGTQTIKNNGFEGHFCIHTTGSKTHGSNKVDSEHQNQVEKALRSTW